jgi:hypothetical protein
MTLLLIGRKSFRFLSSNKCKRVGLHYGRNRRHGLESNNCIC